MCLSIVFIVLLVSLLSDRVEISSYMTQRCTRLDNNNFNKALNVNNNSAYTCRYMNTGLNCED